MSWFGLAATCRASFCVYNSKEDIDALATGINEAIRILG
jgi:selenocysteine lyase/cysteine desulfurase